MRLRHPVCKVPNSGDKLRALRFHPMLFKESIVCEAQHDEVLLIRKSEQRLRRDSFTDDASGQRGHLGDRNCYGISIELECPVTPITRTQGRYIGWQFSDGLHPRFDIELKAIDLDVTLKPLRRGEMQNSWVYWTKLGASADRESSMASRPCRAAVAIGRVE